MTDELRLMAKGILETLTKEDERDFHRKGFYTTRTKAGDCQVLTFQLPEEQRKLTDFEIWRKHND